MQRSMEQEGKQQERGWAAGAGRGCEKWRETDGKTGEEQRRRLPPVVGELAL